MTTVDGAQLVQRTTLVERPRMRLICLPYAGAGTAVYRSWRLREEQAAEVLAVRLAGRETRRAERPGDRLDAIVHELVDGLDRWLDRPFALFGHSMGALLAFELTRALRRLGRPLPSHLFLSAHRAAHLAPSRPPVSSEPEFSFLRRLRDMAGPNMSAVDDPELLLHLAPMIRADFAVCETYQYAPEPPLDIPMTGFCAVDDPEVDVDEVDAWRHQFTRPTALYTYPGGHLFLRSAADDMLARMAERVAETPADPPPP